ncbi:MAG: hypothetical protein IJ532_03120 [Alphaproteobacteria bacterium]|nr:hypothetical protein [Alphaproteobacteria bacterium]
MSRNTKSKNNDILAKGLPCNQCMKYMSYDIKQYKDKLEILYYLQHISDSKILQQIINLLKNITKSKI